jgi:hypothetical protein
MISFGKKFNCKFGKKIIITRNFQNSSTITHCSVCVGKISKCNSIQECVKYDDGYDTYNAINYINSNTNTKSNNNNTDSNFNSIQNIFSKLSNFNSNSDSDLCSDDN